MRHPHLIFLTCQLLFACVKDKPVVEAPVVSLGSSPKVYVINEGLYTNKNSSVSLYEPESGALVQDYYRSVNNSSPGDVLQSMSYINGKFYLIVNNSKKIIVCDKTLKKTEEITGLEFPRYMLQVSNRKAYVSDLDPGHITVIDLYTNGIIRKIACPGWTEGMAMIYDKVFVTNMRSRYTYVIDASLDKITDSVQVGINAGSVVTDRNDKVWVLSSGEENKEAPKLTRIDPLTGGSEAVFTLPVNTSPFNLCINGTRDTLYYISGGVYRMPVSAVIAPTEPFIEKGKKNFYGLGIDPLRFDIYAADVLTYQESSNVHVYSPSGTQKTVFKAGIITNGFYFAEK